jgi:predicted RNA-binding Zn ribbon-like protein
MHAPPSPSGEFPHIGERLCLDFVNTASWRLSDEPVESLLDYLDLVRWSQQMGVLTPQEASTIMEKARRDPSAARGVYERAIRLREAIYRIFASLAAGEAPPAEDVALLNSELEAAPAVLHVATEGGRFVSRWTAPTSSLADLLRPIAWSAGHLLASDEARWVKQCADDRCGWLFVDTTRNHSRRWCAMDDCGSRAKARRYYRRQRAQPDTGT